MLGQKDAVIVTYLKGTKMNKYLEFRKAYDLTQAEMAENLEMSRTKYQDYEKGLRDDDETSNKLEKMSKELSKIEKGINDEMSNYKLMKALNMANVAAINDLSKEVDNKNLEIAEINKKYKFLDIYTKDIEEENKFLNKMCVFFALLSIVSFGVLVTLYAVF